MIFAGDSMGFLLRLCIHARGWHGPCGLGTWVQGACQPELFGGVEEGFEGAVAGGGGLVGEDCVYVDLRLLDVRD